MRTFPFGSMAMTTTLAPGFHFAPGQPIDSTAYDHWVGRWSRLFVPEVLAAAGVQVGQRVLDVSTGTGEAALGIASIIGASGLLVGADIAPAMLEGARSRLNQQAFLPVAADGQALPFVDSSFDAVVCQLGLQFFSDPGLGLIEFRRVLRQGAQAAVCVISTPDRAPVWGVLADVLGRLHPEQRSILQLSFALADSVQLEQLFRSAGFQDIRVERRSRDGIFDSFEDYWAPIAAGTGSIPQIYLSLPEPERDAVREEVRTRLTGFKAGEQLRMSVEMLIASGRA